MAHAYSKKRVSFWSPHIKSSAMERSVSIMSCWLLSSMTGYLINCW